MTSATGQSELRDAIADAARKAFAGLFSDHPGRYYYCTLVTTGEAHAPLVSAWSEEALSAAIRDEGDPEAARMELRWSYADSPFCGYGGGHFSSVNELFKNRPRLTPELPEDEWASEYEIRLGAMEAAMSRLDSEGIFGTGKERLRTVILVEVAPPDHTNTERALRLNPREALTEWLQEAAEA